MNDYNSGEDPTVSFQNKSDEIFRQEIMKSLNKSDQTSTLMERLDRNFKEKSTRIHKRIDKLKSILEKYPPKHTSPLKSEKKLLSKSLSSTFLTQVDFANVPSPKTYNYKMSTPVPFLPRLSPTPTSHKLLIKNSSTPLLPKINAKQENKQIDFSKSESVLARNAIDPRPLKFKLKCLPALFYTLKYFHILQTIKYRFVVRGLRLAIFFFHKRKFIRLVWKFMGLFKIMHRLYKYVIKRRIILKKALIIKSFMELFRDRYLSIHISKYRYNVLLCVKMCKRHMEIRSAKMKKLTQLFDLAIYEYYYPLLIKDFQEESLMTPDLKKQLVENVTFTGFKPSTSRDLKEIKTIMRRINEYHEKLSHKKIENYDKEFQKYYEDHLPIRNKKDELNQLYNMYSHQHISNYSKHYQTQLASHKSGFIILSVDDMARVNVQKIYKFVNRSPPLFPKFRIENYFNKTDVIRICRKYQ